MAIKITRKVFEGIERVRKSGKFNMLDRIAVVHQCMMNGDYDAAEWIAEHKSDYACVIFEGPVVITENEEGG